MHTTKRWMGVMLLCLGVFVGGGCDSSRRASQGSRGDGAESATEDVPAQLEMQTAPVRYIGGETSIPVLPLVIYKTEEDYTQLVPVTLNAQGTKVDSYPDPRDLSEHSLPVSLPKGYLLDQRGLSPLSAFTTFTYADFMQRDFVSPQEILENIKNPHPFVAYYVCPITSGESRKEKAREYVEKNFAGCQVKVLHSER